MNKWIIIGFAAFVGLVAYGAMINEENWQKFSAAHHCQMIAKVESQYIYSTNSNGSDVVVPGHTTYHCDDGVTYTRSN